VTRQELEAEIEEKSLDLQAFTRAREIVRARVLEVADSTSPLTPLPHWSGTDAVLGSLDLSIHAMERTLDELRQTLAASKPELRLLTKDES
jgi:hypothetical protein